MCESFFATLECEVLDRRRFRSHDEASMAVFEFIEGWYNPRRRHSAIGYLSPIDHERSHQLPPRSPKRLTVHETGATPSIISCVAWTMRPLNVAVYCIST